MSKHPESNPPSAMLPPSTLTDAEWELCEHKLTYPRLYRADWFRRERHEFGLWVSEMTRQRKIWRRQMGVSPLPPEERRRK